MSFHVTQFSGSRCSAYNCAAASAALAIEWAGGPELTADQIRLDSGISCVPGADTRSGGLRIVDVIRVASSYGVEVNYGGLQSWPTTALRGRLDIGQGCIVLGDAQRAPVSPTAGIVYHSAFVHGRDGSNRTHWHDPRLGRGYWVSVEDVIRYWGVQGGYRYAGFVAPNQTSAPPDTSTGDADMPVIRPTVPMESFSGSVTVKDDGVLVALPDGRTIGLPRGVTKRAYQRLTIPRTLLAGGVVFEGTAYVIGDDLAYILARNVTAAPDTGAIAPSSVTLGPGLYRVP